MLTAVVITAGMVTATAPAAQAIDGTPCWGQVRICVDISRAKAWLLWQGEVTYGPVPVSTGKPGYRTPTGTFKVLWKERYHWSKQYNGPMPYSLFFTRNGHAIHEGNINYQSHGCIRTWRSTAQKFFERVKVGQIIQIRP